MRVLTRNLGHWKVFEALICADRTTLSERTLDKVGLVVSNLYLEVCTDREASKTKKNLATGLGATPGSQEDSETSKYM